jgi:hypothetical protein
LGVEAELLTWIPSCTPREGRPEGADRGPSALSFRLQLEVEARVTQTQGAREHEPLRQDQIGREADCGEPQIVVDDQVRRPFDGKPFEPDVVASSDPIACAAFQAAHVDIDREIAPRDEIRRSALQGHRLPPIEIEAGTQARDEGAGVLGFDAVEIGAAARQDRARGKEQANRTERHGARSFRRSSRRSRRAGWVAGL